MRDVELIYDNDCPNVEAARDGLRQALADAGAPLQWQEWERSDPDSPDYVRGYGSPTVLVDGSDVAGASPSDGADCCRLYTDETGQFQSAPSRATIAAALRGSTATSESTDDGRRAWLAVIPAVGVSLLPKLACPACWPAYAGLLSAVGLGFLTDTAYLLPLTALFLVIAVGALGLGAGRRRGYAPFALGLLAAVVVLTGKFIFNSNPAMYAGIALLIGASLWNSWPRNLAGTQSRRACCSTDRLYQPEPFPKEEFRHGSQTQS